MSKQPAPTLDEIRTWPATVSVEKACLALGISRGYGYQLIVSEDFPCKVISRGRTRRVVTAALIRLLDESGPDEPLTLASA